MSNAKRPGRPTVPPRKGQAQGTPKGTQIGIAVIAAMCVGAIVLIPVLLNRGDDGGGDGPGDGGSNPPVASVQSPAGVDEVRCDEAPPTPSNPPQFSQPPDPSLAESATWEATVHTSCGDIRIDLDGSAAPQTVASFISLARGGYWNDSPCHRLTTPASGISVLQCGDPTGTGGGSPGYGFGIENAPPSGEYPRGTLAMARSEDPNSNGGQFFIVYKLTRLPTAGGGYSIFGKVTQGLQIVDAIAAHGVHGNGADGAPAQPISILSVEVAKR
jgi:peptidyl-prolyl cis-trans isomerase B (cyclophilin B)